MSDNNNAGDMQNNFNTCAAVVGAKYGYIDDWYFNSYQLLHDYMQHWGG